MAYDFFGIPVGELNVWLIWILPFAAALIIPAVGKFSKFQQVELLLLLPP